MEESVSLPRQQIVTVTSSLKEAHRSSALKFVMFDMSELSSAIATSPFINFTQTKLSCDLAAVSDPHVRWLHVLNKHDSADPRPHEDES